MEATEKEKIPQLMARIGAAAKAAARALALAPTEAKNKALTEAAIQSLGAPRESVRIILREMPPAHFAVGGQSVAAKAAENMKK